ncbi:hypothetical protein SLA2020_290940 [Shorea laevis]
MSEDLESRKIIDEIDNQEDIVPANNVSHGSGGRPFVGMQFPTDDDAVGFYKEYAMRMGFSIRKESAKRSRPDEPITRRYLVCYRAAYKRKPESERAKKRIHENEEGCQARMAINLKDGAWIIKQFFDEHNHEMVSCPKRSRKLASHNNKQRLQPSAREFTDKYSEARCSPSKTAGVLNASSKENDRVTPLEAWNLRKALDEVCERAIKDRVLYNSTIVILEDLMKKLGIIGTTRDGPSVEQHEQVSSTQVVSEGVPSTNLTIWDPEKANTNGRPKEATRIPLVEEVLQAEAQKRPRTCGVCHDKGHNSRTCLVVKERAKENI